MATPRPKIQTYLQASRDTLRVTQVAYYSGVGGFGGSAGGGSALCTCFGKFATPDYPTEWTEKGKR